MTPKQIDQLKRLAIITMTSDFLNDQDKINRYMEIMDFLKTARDLFLIDEKKRDKISKEIGTAAMDAHLEWIKKKEDKTA